MQRSVLGQLLPEAMVNYLENHGAEKFAQIFLGEFDTPEAIWNSEMRQVGSRTKFIIISLSCSCPLISISDWTVSTATSSQYLSVNCEPTV
jgi:hypothetical protein